MRSAGARQVFTLRRRAQPAELARRLADLGGDVYGLPARGQLGAGLPPGSTSPDSSRRSRHRLRARCSSRAGRAADTTRRVLLATLCCSRTAHHHFDPAGGGLNNRQREVTPA